MTLEDPLFLLAERLGEALRGRGWQLATAESCTGGWVDKVEGTAAIGTAVLVVPLASSLPQESMDQVAKLVTDVPGSSHWFDRGFVTYTNISKQEMLGVAAATLQRCGAVSQDTVVEMAEGALRHSQAQLSVAISGIAGPGGATPDKPVGTVCLAWAGTGLATISRTEHFSGDREAVRRQAVEAALRQRLADNQRFQLCARTWTLQQGQVQLRGLLEQAVG